MNSNEDVVSQCLEQLLDGVSKDINAQMEALLRERCTHCRYAKTCNPKRNVKGFTIINSPPVEYPVKELTAFAPEVRFGCSKFKRRSCAVDWQETRIYKTAKGGRK